MDAAAYSRIPGSSQASEPIAMSFFTGTSTKTTSTVSDELNDVSINQSGPRKHNSTSRTWQHLKQKSRNWTKQTLRSLRLLMFMAISPWKSKQEDSKIAIFSGWTATCIGLLVHILPLAATIVLISLHISNYWVGSPKSSLTFQFLAKFLELLAQTSIGSTVFSYLRRIATDQEPVPFGALLAGLQTTHLSYLWSLDFAGVVISQWFRWKMKMAFLILISVSVILASGLGPSFAIALTPTLGDSPSGWGDVWLNATEQELFPTELDASLPPYNRSIFCRLNGCLDLGWQNALREKDIGLESQGTIRLDSDAQAEVKLIGWNLTRPYWQYRTAVTVTPPFISELLAHLVTQWKYEMPRKKHFGSALGTNLTVHTSQPTSAVSCSESLEWLNSTAVRSDDDHTSIVLNSEALGHAKNGSELWQIIFMDDVEVDIEVSNPEYTSHIRPSLWIAIKQHTNFGADIRICAVYAGYLKSKITVTDTYELSSQVLSGPKQTMEIPSAWATQIFPPVESLVYAGITEGYMSAFLSNLFAISLARLPGRILAPGLGGAPDGRSVMCSSPSSHSRNDCLKSEVPEKHWFGPSVKDHNLFGANEDDTKGKHKLRINMSSRGYAYRIDRPTKIVAIVVLSVYSLYTLTSIVITLLFNRVHSNSWDTIAELTALAVLSKPTTRLRNTSAAIETVELFKEPVNIRAVDQDHLEIVFENDCGDRAVQAVQKDTKY